MTYHFVPETTFDFVPLSFFPMFGMNDEHALEYARNLLFEIAPILPLVNSLGWFVGWRIKGIGDFTVQKLLA